MKILHVAVFTQHSTNVWQADAFEELGHEVIRYDYRQRVKDLGSFGLRNAELITLCRKEQPDMILFSKCNKMHVSVVTECGKVGTTVLWYMDPKGNIDHELLQKIKGSHYVFSARWDGYESGILYNKRTYRIHEGYDPKIHRPMDVAKIRDACFIGELRSDRITYRNAIKFDVINNAFSEEHARVVSETRINLNFTEGDGTSDRTYKVLASGGFLLTQPWRKMEKDFEAGRDLVTFTSPTDLKEKMIYYLNNDDERENIAKCGHNTVKKYDNINYAKQIIETVEEGNKNAQ